MPKATKREPGGEGSGAEVGMFQDCSGVALNPKP